MKIFPIPLHRDLSALLIAAIASMLLLGAASHAQDLSPAQAPAKAETETSQTAIVAETDARTDAAIRGRIQSIFSEIGGLRDVSVGVSAGVVTLSGTVPTEDDVDRAAQIAGRVAGVVTVQSEIERDLKVDTNLTPVLGKFTDDLRGLVRGLPLMGVGLVIAIAIGALGYLLAAWGTLWRKITPNRFLAELLATLIRFIFVVLGLVTGLEIIGATALLGAVLGGAGVIGIAIGFAVRDTVDNYVSSLMLSLRQPFRANDHVVIEGHEGRVLRLTSRATILMTLEGNHLRIPNSTVFKAVILNYTRNPERRFDFELGIDSGDDPIAGMAMGLQAIRNLPFVLENPAATAIITEIGDSNIVLRFFAWLDQSQTDFLKGRSLALDATKRLLEESGFALPEPIYRLRFDQAVPEQIANIADHKHVDQSRADKSKRRDEAPFPAAGPEAAPDAHVAKLVEDERAGATNTGDLLDDQRPVE